MKRPIPAILSAAMAVATSSANLAIPYDDADAFLVHEEVSVRLTGEGAEVSGTFTYQVDRVDPAEWPNHDYPVLTLYLPVYAAEGATIEDIRPRLTRKGKELELDRFVSGAPRGKTTVLNPNAGRFGTMPSLDGQKAFWFSVSFVPGQQKETVNFTYRQGLADGKFIYTPLIPKMKKDHDYGGITVSGDRPIRLLDEDKHGIEKKGDKIVVEPVHKRAIVVQVGEAAGDRVP